MTKLERIEWTRGGMRRFVDVEPGATNGATLGKNVYDADGKLITNLGEYLGAEIVARDTKFLNGVPVERIITPSGTLVVSEIQADAIRAGTLTENVQLGTGGILAKSGGKALALGAGMGADNLLAYYGAAPAGDDLDLVAKAGAAFWIDDTGAAYFGGGLAETKVAEQLGSRGLAFGPNMLPNPTFRNNAIGAASNAATVNGQILVDGWSVSRAENTWDVNTYCRWIEGEGIRCYVAKPVAVPNGTYVAPQAATLGRIPVEGGAAYIFGFERAPSFNGTSAAGVTYLSRIVVVWFDAADAQISSAVPASLGRVGTTQAQGDATAPATARWCRVYLDTIVTNNSGAAWTHDSTAALFSSFRSSWMMRKYSLDDHVDDGANYARYSALDGYSSGGFRRIGLRIAGSGHRIGDQRNLPQSLVNAAGSVRTATALTATSAGAVSVNAHTVRLGGISVAYSAVANAVTGLTVGTAYWIYCTDADYTGGTKTWSAGTDLTAIMNGNDGVVLAGKVTIPSSGSSGGGGAGDCVLADQELACGRRAGSIRAGDWIWCWNGDPDHPEAELVQVESNQLGWEPATRIRTASAEVCASDLTPMTLRDGRTIRIPQMLGEDALVRDDCEGLAWEPVLEVEDLGYRQVAHIRVRQRCYFAGTDGAATIATHNPTYKP